MLLRGIEHLKEWLPAEVADHLQDVASGASIGLFRFDSDKVDPKIVRDGVQRRLAEHDELKHATFVVDVVPVGDAPALAHQDAIAANRWRQMQSLSLSVVDLFGQDATQPCYFDRVRPATTEGHIPDVEKKDDFVSTSVFARRKYGRDQRRDFYREEKQDPDLRFTTELGQIADPHGLSKAQAPPSTGWKIAVLYLDGNKFGQKAAAWDKGAEGYRVWSDKLREHHRELLRKLLGQARSDDAWSFKDEKNVFRLRLETLLWGGDEIIWVMPAWKGWEVASWFLNAPHEGRSYKAGLAFCHYNAPIQGVLRVAHSLADQAAHESESRLAYETLESQDDDGGDFERGWKRWLPEGEPKERLLLTARQLKGIEEPLRVIAASSDFPTRQLYMLVHAWRKNGSIAPHEKRLLGCEVGDAVETFRAAIGSEAAWLHLLQMLPYIPTERRP